MKKKLKNKSPNKERDKITNRIWKVNEQKKNQFLRPRCKIAIKNKMNPSTFSTKIRSQLLKNLDVVCFF